MNSTQRIFIISHLFNMLNEIDNEWIIITGHVGGFAHNDLILMLPNCGSYIHVKKDLSFDYNFYCDGWEKFFDCIMKVRDMKGAK